MGRKTFIYTDELNDDFGKTVKKIKPLSPKYKYKMGIFTRVASFILYRLVARPFAWLYMKIRFGHKIVNRKALRGVKNGYVIFSNHTLLAGDAFAPNLLSLKRRNFIITGKDASSLTSILWLMKTVGNIPIGTNATQQIKMLRCVKEEIEKGNSVTVFPEAHVWPYYTDIRRFGADSARFALLLDAPVFTLTTCFEKRRFTKSPRVISYVDGPFYPDSSLSGSARAEDLNNRAYNAMKRRAAECSTYAYHQYIEKEREFDYQNN